MWCWQACGVGKHVVLASMWFWQACSVGKHGKLVPVQFKRVGKPQRADSSLQEISLLLVQGPSDYMHSLAIAISIYQDPPIREAADFV